MRGHLGVQSIRSNDQCQNSPGLGHRQLYAKGNPLNDRAGCNRPIRGKCLENGPTRDKLIFGPFVQSKNGHFCMFVDSYVWLYGGYMATQFKTIYFNVCDYQISYTTCGSWPISSLSSHIIPHIIPLQAYHHSI